jgi:hypothetical protein
MPRSRRVRLALQQHRAACEGAVGQAIHAASSYWCMSP